MQPRCLVFIGNSSAGVIGGTVGGMLLVITATCLGARCLAARTKKHFPPADGQEKEEEAKTPSSPSSTEDMEGGLIGGSSRQVSDSNLHANLFSSNIGPCYAVL